METRVPSVEYRGRDGAWYDVSVQLREDHGKSVLNIHYEGIPDRGDEQMAAEDPQNLQEIKDKLRLSSKQLQDKYCRKVTNGLIVCASSDWQDNKFFDARVQEVIWSKHILVNDEEQCMCRYKVLWLAGPCVGETTTIHCENIRLRQFGSIQRHPAVKEFLQMIKGNMGCRSQSSGRNPLRKRVANLEDSLSEPNNPHPDSVTTGEEEYSINQCDDGCSEDAFLTSEKVKQGELGRETNEDVRNCNSGSNSLVSKDERRTLGELCDQSRCEVLVFDGAAFSRYGGKHFKGDDLSLMRKEEKDCLPDLNVVPNHPQLIQQFIPTNTEGIVNDLSQCKEIKDADVHISVEDCFIPGERSTEKYATTGSFSMPGAVVNIDCGDLGKLSSSAEFPASMMPSYVGQTGGVSPDVFCKGINGEKEGKNNVEIADATGCLSLNQHCSTVNGHGIKRNLSFLVIENEYQDFESSGDRGKQDAVTQKLGKIQELTPNDGMAKECTASSRGTNKRSKHKEKEIFESDNYVWNHKHIAECRQDLDTFKFPIKDSLELDALSSDYLKASYLEYHKKKKPEHDPCECVGMMPRNIGKSDNCVQVSMWDQQIKQPLCKETRSVADFSEAVNMLYDNKHGDIVQKNGFIHEHKRSCRPSESDMLLRRSSCATVESDDTPFSHDEYKAVQGNSCWEREEYLKKSTSKCKACRHTPFMQSHDACRFDLGLHNCCMEFSSPSFHSDALCRASWRDSCEDHDRCHYCPSCKLNCSSCSFAIHSRASELQLKSRSHRNCNQNVHVTSCSNSISAGPCHKGRNHTKAQYEYSAKCTMRECFKEQTGGCRVDLGLGGDTFYSSGQSKHCGCYSLDCKEYNIGSSHCLEDGRHCLVSSEGESIDLEGTNEFSEYGNCNVCAYRSSKSSRKVNASGKAVIVEEVRYNSMQRAVREIRLDAECGCGVKEDVKVQARIFPSSQVVLLENLEKDVTPLDVLGVIHQATCALVQVCISPSYKFEQFTRGFVCFEDQLSLQKALAFLQDEDIFITSSNGRPWVVLSVENGLYDGFYGDFTIGSKIVRPSCGTMPSNKIKIYPKGTLGYEKAKLLKGIFLQLREHTMLHHRRLGHEESKI